MIKVAIADDHPLVLTGLQYVLHNAQDMELTGSYMNGAELLRGIPKLTPDVLLLDIQMPGQQGDELTEILLQTYPLLRIIALTNLDSTYYIQHMLRAGAHGYVLKSTLEDILLKAIRTVHRGEQFVETSLQDKMLKSMRQAKRQMAADPALSRREKEILQMIASDMTSAQMAEKLFISKRTVDAHRVNLLVKLGVKNTANLVKKAVIMGLIE